MIGPQLINRRDALQKLSAGTLLALGFWPGALRAAEATAGRTFKFVVINDTHCMSAECVAYLDQVVAALKKQDPAFCLHVGDLTDKAERMWFEAVRDSFAKLGAPTHFTIGNHDYATDTDRAAYEAVFPKQLNYSFEHEGWQVVALDTTQGQRFQQTAVQPSTLDWLDENLPRLDRRKPTVIFTHFPLAASVKMRPTNAEALLERMKDFNVRAVYNGHYHAFTEHPWREAPVTTNRCCALKRDNHDGTKEKGFFVCTAQDGRISRQFVEFKPV